MPVRQQQIHAIRAIGERYGIARATSKMLPMPSVRITKGDISAQKGTAIFSFHAIKNITCAEGGLIKLIMKTLPAS